MTWVRIDDGAPLHPKLLEVGPEAAWLWVAGLAHCNRSTTDGVIRKVFLTALYPSGHLSPKRLGELASKLVAARLWHDEGDSYRVHQYEIQQELAMKEEVEARRAYERERKTRQRREKLATLVRDNSGTLSRTTAGHSLQACAVSPTPGPARPGPALSEGGESEPPPALRDEPTPLPGHTGAPWRVLVEPIRNAILEWAQNRRVAAPKEAAIGNEGAAIVPIAKWLWETGDRQGWAPGERIDRCRWLVRERFYGTKDARTQAKGYPLAWLAANPAEYALDSKRGAA